MLEKRRTATEALEELSERCLRPGAIVTFDGGGMMSMDCDVLGLSRGLRYAVVRVAYHEGQCLVTLLNNDQDPVEVPTWEIGSVVDVVDGGRSPSQRRKGLRLVHGGRTA